MVIVSEFNAVLNNHIGVIGLFQCGFPNNNRHIRFSLIFVPEVMKTLKNREKLTVDGDEGKVYYT
jgi:hypothetical protein